MSKALLTVLAVPAGAVLAYVTLLGTSYLPSSNRPIVWLGVPLLVMITAGWWVRKRSPRVGVLLVAAGLVTLAFFVWLFWQVGDGLQDS